MRLKILESAFLTQKCDLLPPKASKINWITFKMTRRAYLLYARRVIRGQSTASLRFMIDGHFGFFWVGKCPLLSIYEIVWTNNNLSPFYAPFKLT